MTARVTHLFILFLLVILNTLQVTGKLLPLSHKHMPCNHIFKAASRLHEEVVKPGETMVLYNIHDIGSYHERGSRPHPSFTFFNIKTNKNMTTFLVKDRSLITLSTFYTHCPVMMNETLKMIKYFPIYNPSRKTLLVDLSNDAEDVIIPKYFKVLWHNQFMQPIIMKLRRNSSEPLVDIYRWPTLAPASKCGTNISTYRKVGFYNPQNNSFIFFDPNERFFLMLPPKKLSSCQLKVSVVVNPPFVFPSEKIMSGTDHLTFKRGFEIKLITTIAENYGVNITYKISSHPLDWGTLEENGSATGIYKDLLNGDTDIGISSFTYIPQYAYLDFGPPYACEDWLWCIPKIPKSTMWTKLLSPYRSVAWFLYNLAFILTSVVLWQLSKSRRGEPRHNQNLVNCIFKCARDIYGNTHTSNFPKAPLLRMFYIIWLFFTLHMTVLYSGSLFSLLSTDHTDNYNLMTLTDIFKSKLRLLVLSSTRSYFTNDNSSIIKLGLKEAAHCGNLRNCLEEVAIRQDAALCVTSSMAQFVQKLHWAIVCPKNAKLVSFPVTMVIRKHHYLSHEIYKKALYLFEGGLIEYWRKEAINSYTNHRKGYYDDFQKLDESVASSSRNGTITFKDIKPAFKILLTGHLLATIVFLFEIGSYYRKMYLKYKRDAEVAYIGFNN